MSNKGNPPKCKMCDNNVKRNYSNKTGWCVYCSAKCRANDVDYKQGIIQKYGEHPAHTTEIKEKRKRTNIQKYGVEHPLQNKEIHQHTLETTTIRYGGILRGSNIISEKSVHTMLKKYGVEYSGQSNELLQKQISTNLEKYGVARPLQNEKILTKSKETNMKRYGVRGPGQLHMVNSLIKLESSEWLYDQYVIQHKTSVMIAKEIEVDPTTVCNYLRIHEIDIIYTIGFSRICVYWLEHTMKRDGIYIQHILNEGEYKIPETRYRADGYCRETNTIYEFHGDRFHGNPKLFTSEELCHPYNDTTAGELYQNTIERETQIKELGYNLVVMWENDYTM